MPALRILLIDDHALFRSGMRLLLQGSLPGAQVLESESVEQAFDLSIGGVSAPDTPLPSLVLLDIQLQGMNGMAGLGLIRQRWPGVPVIMLSSIAEPETITAALSGGASAFFSKAGTAEEIVALIRQALGSMSISKAVADVPSPRLTPRQLEVLMLVNEGLSNKAIARRLDLSEFTVRGHVQAVLGLLGVSSRSQAIFAARGAGLLS